MSAEETSMRGNASRLQVTIKIGQPVMNRQKIVHIRVLNFQGVKQIQKGSSILLVEAILPK